MNFQNPNFTPAMASARIRTLWQNFEQSQAKDRAQLDRSVQLALEKTEAAWNKTPTNSRMSRIKHNAAKVGIAKAIKTTYFEKARAQWHEKLESYGLKADYWTDLTEDEKMRITNTLGADDESDEEVVVILPESSPPPIPHPTTTHSSFLQPLAPSFSTSSRATNLSSSSYALVNPSEFNSDEDDFEFEIPLSNPVATSVDLTSEEDDDPVFSLPSYPFTRSTVVPSSFSRSSPLQNPSSNLSKTPSARSLVSGFAYNAAPSGAAPTTTTTTTTKRQQISQNDPKPAPTKARIPRQPYVGPSLDTPDEPINEELDFEKFKMRTRMKKIVEFHEAAALAEISLSIEIYKARKQLSNSNEEDAPRVLEHQKRMVQLQREKEEERKAIVKSERARRQSELGRRRSTPEDANERSIASDAFETWETWDLSSFQEEINLPSRFSLDTLLSDDPAKQQTNVESLLSEMFADNYQPPEAASLFNSYSSASSKLDAFRDSASIYDNKPEPLRQQSHPPVSWNKLQSSQSSKPPRKTRLSPFGESSDEEDGAPAAVRNTGWAGTDELDSKPTVPIWNHKQNAPTPSAWSSKNISTTPVNSGLSNKDAAAAPLVIQPRPGSNILSNSNSFFDPDENEPEPTATPVMNSKAAKGKKSSLISASDKPSVSPPIVETTTGKASATETPAISPTPAPAPVGKKQNKKQRQANKKGGAAAIPTTVAETAIPEQEPEPEPVPPQQVSPKPQTPAVAPDPVQNSEHASWLPKTVPAMARARMESGSTPPGSFSWDEISSTPRPAPKIPAHIHEVVKSEGTPRPNIKKQNLMAEVFSATSSRTTLEQMPPPTSIAKGGPVWASAVPLSSTPGPSLWGKTKADFEKDKVAQQPIGGSNFWVPGGFEGVDNYNDDDGGGGGAEGGSEDRGVGLWESMTTHSKQQLGKATPISVKQQPSSSVAAQRQRRVSEAASSSPSPRELGTKDLSDIGQGTPATVNSNSKKARGKKNGKGKAQRVTIEDVSDEEKDNIDILPQDSNFIMESKVILEPKPSVPHVVYNPIIDFADNDVMKDNSNSNNGYLSSSFMRPTTSSSSSSSPDDNILEPSSHFSSAFFRPSQGGNASMSSGSGAGSTMMGGGGKHARWTPAAAVSHEIEESSGLPSFTASSSSFGSSRLQAKPSSNQQQTPIWGQQSTKLSAKDKGKRKV